MGLSPDKIVNRRSPAAGLVPVFFHGADNALVSGTAAEVVGETVADLVAGHGAYGSQMMKIYLATASFRSSSTLIHGVSQKFQDDKYQDPIV